MGDLSNHSAKVDPVTGAATLERQGETIKVSRAELVGHERNARRVLGDVRRRRNRSEKRLAAAETELAAREADVQKYVDAIAEVDAASVPTPREL